MNYRKQEEILTILTDPIPSLAEYYLERIKSLLRPVLRKIDGKQPLVKKKYGGHYAVTRSLIEGLEKANIPFVYNPRREKQCTNIVVVLAGLQTLEQMLKLKAAGKIRLLAAGPNLVIMPSDSPSIIGNKLIDKFILNSDWIKNAYTTEMPQLLPYTIIWPAGVDEEFWKPAIDVKKKNKALFYSKGVERDMYKKCKTITHQMGVEVMEVVYGEYTSQQYKSLLNECRWLVYFGEQESQGISLLESWAMDVPTIVWNHDTYLLNGTAIASSSAPYLSSDTGIFFKDLEDFESCISLMLFSSVKFSPRDWVLKNMTDELIAKSLITQLSFLEGN